MQLIKMEKYEGKSLKEILKSFNIKDEYLNASTKTKVLEVFYKKLIQYYPEEVYRIIIIVDEDLDFYKRITMKKRLEAIHEVVVIEIEK